MGGPEPETTLRALPETRRALSELSRYEDEDLNDRFDSLVRDVTRLAPDCGGLTISYLREGLAFTWLSTGVQVSLLDGVQYLDGGPCVDAARVGEAVEADAQSALSEEQWALFAKIAAAGGVRSTLSLPYVRDGQVVGGVNLYGTTESAFEGRREALADLLGAWSEGAVTNADLTLSGVQLARETPRNIENTAVLDQAVGMLMAAQGVDSGTALSRLAGAAERAGIDTSLLAHVVVKGRLLG
jgi:GAF domain-containing protein